MREREKNRHEGANANSLLGGWKGTHMYAIVKTGGKQYTVKPGDVLDVEKIEGERCV